MTQGEQTAQFFGALLAATIAGLVSADARRRGLPTKAVWGWGAGVFLLLIVFLPCYLWLRNRDETESESASQKPHRVASQSASAACLYCEYPNPQGTAFCAKCGRQLKSSTEIHG